MTPPTAAARGLVAGQRAVVTGGASGIGEATVRRLVAEGARVAVLDRDEAGAERVAAAVGAVAVPVDVADTDAFIAAIDRAAAELGGLDALVSNAGIGSLKPLHAYTDREWRLLLDVNLTATFAGLRAAVPHLRAAGGGSVVHLASVSGLRPTRGEAPYAAAKAGVIALTQGAALEYGPDKIRVNCVSPGFVHTALTDFACTTPHIADRIAAATPLGRIGTADEIADVIVFLCSDLARYVTGQNLVVDGGSMLPSAQVDFLLSALLEGRLPEADG